MTVLINGPCAAALLRFLGLISLIKSRWPPKQNNEATTITQLETIRKQEAAAAAESLGERESEGKKGRIPRMAMGEAKPSVLIPMPSRDRDRDLLVPPAAVATHASPSTRAGAGSDDDDDESKPSSASAAAAAAQTGREVAALPFPPISPFQLGSPRIGGGFFSQI